MKEQKDLSSKERIIIAALFLVAVAAATMAIYTAVKIGRANNGLNQYQQTLDKLVAGEGLSLKEFKGLPANMSFLRSLSEDWCIRHHIVEKERKEAAIDLIVDAVNRVMIRLDQPLFPREALDGG